MNKTARTVAALSALVLAGATGSRAQRPLPDPAWSFDTGG